MPADAELKHRTGIFGITLSTNRRILVTSPAHALDIHGLPGGGREGTETHFQTLQREYFEELGPFFVLKKNVHRVFQQRIFYYAKDLDEYWCYQQYYYLARLIRQRMPGSHWVSPEGGHAQWLPLSDYHRIIPTHVIAIAQYLK